MNPRAIEVHIEELVLHGFEPGARWPVGDALEKELGTLLRRYGLPKAWQGNAASLKAGSLRLTSKGLTGAQIAEAIHGGEKE
ncbi:MAG TPA: hypothetical protein VGG02_08025 [Chthoniobacterales bacterium]|jgi:hypothetical protein